MSSKPFPKSPERNVITAKSIKVRTSELLSHEFFTQFPVVIVASGNYVSEKMYGIDLESTFNQMFIGACLYLNSLYTIRCILLSYFTCL